MNQKVTSCYECIINRHHQAISTRVHIIMSYWILLLYLVMNYKQTIIENASYNNRYAYFPSLYKFRKVSFDPTEPRLNQWEGELDPEEEDRPTSTGLQILFIPARMQALHYFCFYSPAPIQWEGGC